MYFHQYVNSPISWKKEKEIRLRVTHLSLRLQLPRDSILGPPLSSLRRREAGHQLRKTSVQAAAAPLKDVPSLHGLHWPYSFCGTSDKMGGHPEPWNKAKHCHWTDCVAGGWSSACHSLTDSPYISIPAESPGFSPGLLPSAPNCLTLSLL